MSVSVVNSSTIILLQVVMAEHVLLSTQPVAHGIVKRLFVIELYKPVIRTMIIMALARYILKVHILGGAIVFRILVLKVVKQVAWLVIIMDGCGRSSFGGQGHFGGRGDGSHSNPTESHHTDTVNPVPVPLTCMLNA